MSDSTVAPEQPAEQQNNKFPPIDKIQQVIQLLEEQFKKEPTEAKYRNRLFALRNMLGYLEKKNPYFRVDKCACGDQYRVLICQKPDYYGALVYVCSKQSGTEGNCGKIEFRGWST